MKQFLTFLFIWLIPILSNANAKTNTIAGNRVNSVSSKTCNCFFPCDHQQMQASINPFEFQSNNGSMQFGNNSGQNESNTSGEQWTKITNVCLLLFGLLLTIYLILKVLTIRNRIRS